MKKLSYEQFKKLPKGTKLKIEVKGKKYDAVIQIEDDDSYICQDVKDGDECDDMLGFNFSWFINCKDNFDDFSAVYSGAGKIKEPKVNFLLQYELDEDPIEEFETMPEVRKRIKELMATEDSLKEDSMKVYEIKSVKIVKISKSITIK